MVASVMKWRPWPSLSSRKFEARLIVRNLSGFCELCKEEMQLKRFKVEIRWQGSKTIALRKKENVNHTKEADVSENGEIQWNENFQHICTLQASKEKLHPYEVKFSVISKLGKKPRSKTFVVGTAMIDLAELACGTAEEHELDVDVVVPGGTIEKVPSLRLCLTLLELRSVAYMPRSIHCVPLSPPSKDVFKEGLRRVRTLARSRKVGHEQESDDADCSYSDFDEEEEDVEYETLATANLAGEGSFSANEWIFLQTGCRSPPKMRLLAWRKRKLSFKKGEPLLKKYYGEEGGDDIDFDRRQFIPPEKPSVSPMSFEDDDFTVGRWERKEVTSRDGKVKLETLVFFASIDQRSELAAGEGACTVLAVILANWLLYNKDQTPIQSQFDSLIREGSLKWRKLCEDETYKTTFPDKHFDLETVLKSDIESVTTIPEKSFIGFFHSENMTFLDGAMSFEEIWSKIGRGSEEENDPAVYIVSWNDHFFVLKVERDAYYIVDTLGERYCEGCNQAFILRFDRSSVMSSSDDGDKCGGKNACKEYILGFLAAIPVGEVEADVRGGLKDPMPIHRCLQIEFHYALLGASGNQS